MNDIERRNPMFMKLQEAAAPKKVLALFTAAMLGLGSSATPGFAATNGKRPTPIVPASPIQHLVVIFNENISFDHYFGTYPVATNPAGEPKFKAAPGTPAVNGLIGGLLTNNPNLNPANVGIASNPFRLDRSQAVTTDQDHDYEDEQSAFDSGLMDLFPSHTGYGTTEPMGYFDGNTATALWNYAQFFALSDNSYGTTFGPSSPGLINLVSGQTNGAVNIINGLGDEVSGGPDGSYTLIGDADPRYDVCSNSTRNQVQMSGPNIGDLLNASGVTWGGFMGGFNLTIVNSNGTTGCNRSSAGLAGTTADYVPHHSLFGYYASTANPNHTPPASCAEIGIAGPANHQYDIQDFYNCAATNLPAVSFLKAPAYQDGHAGYSDPLDEQTFVVNTINFLESLPTWSNTAVVIAYDDSDGWYDHQMGPIVNTSTGAADALTGPGACGTAATSLPGVNPTANPHALGRCGYGPRLPLLVISPWARQNFVDHSVTDQTSIIHFIEDNWLGGQRLGSGSFDGVAGSIVPMFRFGSIRSNGTLLLDPNTGEPQ
jgi:phospholipase C